jgi:cytochrome c oxidase subunit 1
MSGTPLTTVIETPYFADRKKYGGLLGWLTATDHKRIGILYLVSISAFFTIAVLLGVLMRVTMLPGCRIVSAQQYNALFTLHGIIQVFLVVIPAVPTIFGNFFLPILIGGNDMYFPRLNLFTFYLYILGATLALVSVTFGGGAVDTGWTFYVPFSLTTTVNVPFAVFAVFILGMSSILTGINIVTTVHLLRAPGMDFFKMPLSVWGFYATAWVQILATPIIGVTMLLVVAERLFGIGVFDPSKGGDPLLYQHLFWIYSHPAVYIMVLPSMGVISDIFPVFSRKNIYGYKMIAFSSLAIASVGSLVWGHHMYVSGQSDPAGIVFSLLTFLVAVPSAIKVFNWLATMYKGSIRIEPPFLYAHNTYFVVGHFHYVIFGGMGFGLFAALHYWLPKMTGRMYGKRMANVSWLVLFTGFNIFYFPMLILGWQGMPRRYYEYLPQYSLLHQLATIGSFIMVAGLFLVIVNLVRSIFSGEKAPSNPWGGVTLEWTLPSPPPTEDFEHPPLITKGPYEFPKSEAPV